MSDRQTERTLDDERHITIGLNIVLLRRRAGMTQSELAEKIDASVKHISNIENPNVIQAVSLNTLFKIADAFGVTVQSLFNGI